MCQLGGLHCTDATASQRVFGFVALPLLAIKKTTISTNVRNSIPGAGTLSKDWAGQKTCEFLTPLQAGRACSMKGTWRNSRTRSQARFTCRDAASRRLRKIRKCPLPASGFDHWDLVRSCRNFTFRTENAPVLAPDMNAPTKGDSPDSFYCCVREELVQFHVTEHRTMPALL